MEYWVDFHESLISLYAAACGQREGTIPMQRRRPARRAQLRASRGILKSGKCAKADLLSPFQEMHRCKLHAAGFFNERAAFSPHGTGPEPDPEHHFACALWPYHGIMMAERTVLDSAKYLISGGAARFTAICHAQRRQSVKRPLTKKVSFLNGLACLAPASCGRRWKMRPRRRARGKSGRDEESSQDETRRDETSGTSRNDKRDDVIAFEQGAVRMEKLRMSDRLRPSETAAKRR